MEVDGGVAEQDPRGTAHGSEDLVPLDKPGGIEEGVAQAEPGPREFDVEVNMFPGKPGNDEEEQRKGVGCEGIMHTLADDAAAPASDGQDGGHLQGVEEQCGDGSDGRDEPDPEGGQDVEGQESHIIIPECVPDLLFAEEPVEQEKGEEADQRQESDMGDEEREPHGHAEADGEQPGGASGLLIRSCGFFFHFCSHIVQR